MQRTGKKTEKGGARSALGLEKSRFGEKGLEAPEKYHESKTAICGPLCSVNLMDLPLQAKAEPNRTGMPDRLKEGIEALSGMDMSDVRVHRNSDKPEQLNALAYAQGNQIHIAPGQEKYLPHEAWHAVQQKQRRVSPTLQEKMMKINDDLRLEQEADCMGKRAMVWSEAGVQEPNISLKSMVSLLSDPALQLSALNKNQKKKIKEKIKSKWGKEIQKLFKGANYEDTLDEITDELIGSATQSEALEKIEKFSSYEDWQASMSKAEAPKEKAVDPLSEVKKQIKNHGLNPDDFTGSELQQIQESSKDGWDQAIQIVNSSRIARAQNEQLIKERTARYSGAKARGDDIFKGGLIRNIWNLSYAIAAAGNSAPNTTLGGSYQDSEIIAAAALWQNQYMHSEPPGESVTHMHVPGYVQGNPTKCIEDKSKRELNPDPTRGRQADFICYWGNMEVNVHVNSSVVHL